MFFFHAWYKYSPDFRVFSLTFALTIFHLLFSGVQLIKATSPITSTTKTMSNKESKESVISPEITTELADILEETRSWVEQQTLHTQMISDGGYLAEFFEDNITNDPNKDPKGEDPKTDHEDQECKEKVELHGELKAVGTDAAVESIDNLLSKIDEEQSSGSVVQCDEKEATSSLSSQEPGTTVMVENEIKRTESQERKTSNHTEGPDIILTEEKEIEGMNSKEKKTKLNEDEKSKDEKVETDVQESEEPKGGNSLDMKEEEMEVQNLSSLKVKPAEAVTNKVVKHEVRNRAYSEYSDVTPIRTVIMDMEPKSKILLEPDRSKSQLSLSSLPRIPPINRTICTVEVHQQKSNLTPSTAGEGQDKGGVELQKQGKGPSSPTELEYLESSV